MTADSCPAIQAESDGFVGSRRRLFRVKDKRVVLGCRWQQASFAIESLVFSRLRWKVRILEARPACEFFQRDIVKALSIVSDGA